MAGPKGGVEQERVSANALMDHLLPITPSGVTRLIDRLERDGVVERRACATDGRGTVVAMTADGTEVFRRAGRVHLRGINEHPGANLTLSETAELRRIVTKLAAGIHAANTETHGTGRT